MEKMSEKTKRKSLKVPVFLEKVSFRKKRDIARRFLRSDLILLKPKN